MKLMTLPAFAIVLLPMTSLAAEPVVTGYSEMRRSGTIDDRRILEASGLARSHRVAGRLWTMNDGGSRPQLFAIGSDGVSQGSVSLGNATNVDWEDLASFEHNGKAWLLVADIGDNEAHRPYYSLYIVEEPAEVSGQRLDPTRTIRYRYPEGPLDAEAIAVDAENDNVLVLVKRTVPARLYRIALSADSDSPQLAVLLGDVDSLPQPTAHDLERALPDKSWHWQPTAMDISPDGRHAVILTYRAVYLYSRESRQSWSIALRGTPLRLDLGGTRLAEAVAFGYKDADIFVTVEGRSPPLYRFERDP